MHLCVRKNTNSREIRKLRMKIKCLDPLGINGFERTANEVLAASLPESWKGYSSLEMIGRQGKDFEADLVLITDDRIIIVELKNYAGTIYSVDGKWVQQYSDGRLAVCTLMEPPVCGLMEPTKTAFLPLQIM